MGCLLARPRLLAAVQGAGRLGVGGGGVGGTEGVCGACRLEVSVEEMGQRMKSLEGGK